MEHVIVPELSAFDDRWHVSHAVRHDRLVLLSGVTGTREDGSVDRDPGTRFEQAFSHLGADLAAAGATLGDVLELTSYHLDLRGRLDAFTAVKDRHVLRPSPAWSAIGVSELISPGALVELRVVARSAQPPAGAERAPGGSPGALSLTRQAPARAFAVASSSTAIVAPSMTTP